MKKLSAARRYFLTVAFVLMAGPACAGDWSIQSVISNEINVSENRALREDSEGVSFADVLDVGFDFNYTMPDGHFNIAADMTGYKYFGEASEDGADDILPHVGFDWLKNGRRDSVQLTADYRVENVGLMDPGTLIGPFDDIPVDALLHSTDIGLIWTRKVDARNTLTFDNLIAADRYDSGFGTDNNLVTSTLAWERRLTRTTTGTLTSGLNWLDLRDNVNTNRFIYSLEPGIETQLSKRLTVSVGAGVEFGDTRIDGDDPDNTLSGTFNGSIDYSMKSTHFTFSVDYGMSQDLAGDFQKQLTSAITVVHSINDMSQFSATANLVVGAGDDDGDFGSDLSFYFSPVYSLDLTREWVMQVGYRFERNEAAFNANSHTAFVSMTRDFTVMP